MKNNNICKFVSSPLPTTLSTSCFVRETTQATMKIPFKLEKYRMILITQGQGTFIFDNQAVNFKSGNLIFGFSEELFYLSEGADVSYTYIDFSGVKASELLHRFDVNKHTRIFEGFDGLIPIWEESLFRATEQSIDLAAESILLYTFFHLYGNTTERNSTIAKIIELSEEYFSDADLSITEIAKSLGYNEKYLSHLFKEKMGVNYSEYLRSLRIRHAKSLFDHGLDSVKNVAILSGFHDPLYFSNVFKKVVGLSPREYINKNAN